MKTQTPSIPILDLGPELDARWDELMAAIQGVLRSGEYIMGQNVRAFESECARYLGARHAIGVNSGTDALVIALRALGIGPGDEVITTPFTFFATAEAISTLGALPVFVDIDPETFNLDPAKLEEAVNVNTKAIIPVHVFGQAAEMTQIRRFAEAYGLHVLEDVAQGFGGSYRGEKLGTLGQLGAFSFFPSKNLGGFGDGGLITTQDDELAERCRMLRVHGAKKKYYNEVVGYNSRLDELQAAMLRVKLPHIDAMNHGRREAAADYARLLKDLPGVQVPRVRQAGHVFHQFTIRIHDGKRERVQERLAKAGVATMVYYPVPVHRLPVYAQLGQCLPVAEHAAEEVLSLPIWPHMTHATRLRVVDALYDALS